MSISKKFIIKNLNKRKYFYNDGFKHSFMSARNSGIRQITALDCAKCRENRPNVLISQILTNKEFY